MSDKVRVGSPSRGAELVAMPLSGVPYAVRAEARRGIPQNADEAPGTLIGVVLAGRSTLVAAIAGRPPMLGDRADHGARYRNKNWRAVRFRVSVGTGGGGPGGGGREVQEAATTARAGSKAPLPEAGASPRPVAQRDDTQGVDPERARGTPSAASCQTGT